MVCCTRNPAVHSSYPLGDTLVQGEDVSKGLLWEVHGSRTLIYLFVAKHSFPSSHADIVVLSISRPLMCHTRRTRIRVRRWTLILLWKALNSQKVSAHQRCVVNSHWEWKSTIYGYFLFNDMLLYHQRGTSWARRALEKQYEVKLSGNALKMQPIQKQKCIKQQISAPE